MILPNAWGEFMSTPDLPMYGQILAYGLGALVVCFAIRQSVKAVKEFFETYFWILRRLKEREEASR